MVEFEEQRVFQRNAQIQHCQEQIAFYTQRLEKLRAEQQRDMLLAKASDEPRKTWGRLSNEQKHDKDFVLAALSQDPFFFGDCEFNEEGFTALPDGFREDRDVVLACLRGQKADQSGFSSERSEFRMTVPDFLKDDKEFMLEACVRNGDLLEHASDRLKDDEDVVLAALENLPYEEETFKHISERLRGEKNILLKAVEKSQHGFFWTEFMAPGTSMQVQKDVAIAMALKQDDIDNAYFDPLEFLSDSIRDDKQVMLKFVEWDGCALEWCSTRLRSDKELVQVALKSNYPATVFYAMGKIREELLQDTEIMKKAITDECGWDGSILLLAPISIKQDRSMVLTAAKNGLEYQDVPEPFKTDPEIALLCLGSYSSDMKFSDLFKSLRTDRSFALTAVRKDGHIYRKLPTSLQKDEEIALQVLESKYPVYLCDDFHRLLFENVPSLLESREAIMALASKGKRHSGPTIVDIVGPTCPFFDDKEFVVAACSNDSGVLQHVSERLRWDRDVVFAALSAYGRCFSFSSGTDETFPLCNAAEDFMLDNVDIVVKAIEVSQEQDLDRFMDSNDLPRPLFGHRAVVVALLREGRTVVRHLFPNGSFRRDKQLVAHAVQNDWREFQYAAASLRADREFVLSLMNIDGRALCFAHRDLKYDHEILMVSVANKGSAAIAHCFSASDFDFLASFATNSIRNKLKVHDTFVREFLRGIQGTPPGHESSATRDSASSKNLCLLSLLGCGDETAIALKRNIAEFTGVPLGKDLRLLRVVSASLLKCGF